MPVLGMGWVWDGDVVSAGCPTCGRVVAMRAVEKRARGRAVWKLKGAWSRHVNAHASSAARVERTRQAHRTLDSFAAVVA